MSSTETAVDMRPEAIARRLRTISDLYEFTRTLKGVKWLGKAKDLLNTERAEQERVLGLGTGTKASGRAKKGVHEGQRGLLG